MVNETLCRILIILGAAAAASTVARRGNRL